MSCRCLVPRCPPVSTRALPLSLMRCPGVVLLTLGRSCLPADCLRGASVLRLHRHTSSPSQVPSRAGRTASDPIRPDPSIECDGHLSQIDHRWDCRRRRSQRRMRIWTVVRSPDLSATTSVFVSFTEYDDSISIQSARGEHESRSHVRHVPTSVMSSRHTTPRHVTSRHVTSRHVSSDVMTLQSRHDAPPVTETPLRFASGNRRGRCS